MQKLRGPNICPLSCPCAAMPPILAIEGLRARARDLPASHKILAMTRLWIAVAALCFYALGHGLAAGERESKILVGCDHQQRLHGR
jgi:hypothetical protein